MMRENPKFRILDNLSFLVAVEMPPTTTDAMASAGLFVLSAFLMLATNAKYKKMNWKKRNNQRNDSPVPGEGN